MSDRPSNFFVTTLQVKSRKSLEVFESRSVENHDKLGWLVGWLVCCIGDIRRFSGISAISRLGNGR